MRVYEPKPPNDYIQYQYCPNCSRLLEIEDDDIDEYNKVTCCFCGKVFEVEKLHNPFNWPDSFNYFGDNYGGKNISDKEIQNIIDQIKAQKDSIPIGEFYEVSRSNVKVIGLKYEDDFTITVAINYWEDTEEV